MIYVVLTFMVLGVLFMVVGGVISHVRKSEQDEDEASNSNGGTNAKHVSVTKAGKAPAKKGTASSTPDKAHVAHATDRDAEERPIPGAVIIAADPVLGVDHIPSLIRAQLHPKPDFVVPFDSGFYGKLAAEFNEPAETISLTEATQIMNELDREADGLQAQGQSQS